MKRGFETKGALTPEEKLKAAAAHDLLGVAQHHLAFIFGVNQGRINEAIKEVREATGMNETTSEQDYGGHS